MHHVAFTIESTRLADLIEVVAPLMPDIKSLQIEHLPPVASDEAKRPFVLGRSRTAQAVLRILRGMPEALWASEEVYLGMTSHELAGTSAAPALSLLRQNGYVEREGDKFRLTDLGKTAQF